MKKKLKKLFAVTGCVLILSACNISSGSLQNRLDQAVQDALAQPLSSANNRKQYYSYYLDPSVGRLSSTATGNEFIMDECRFVMNLDVASIINEKYYPETAVTHDYAPAGSQSAYAEGVMTTAEGSEKNYRIQVDQYDEDLYLIHMSAGYLSFECFADEGNVPLCVREMMKISRTVQVDRQEVLAAFTTAGGIDYTGTPVELFEEKAPENGSIEELLIDYDGTATEVPAEEPQAETEKQAEEETDTES